MLTKALVIYDPISCQVLRIIVAEDDLDYPHHHLGTVGQQEAYTFMLFNLGEVSEFRSSLDKAQQAVTLATGKAPPPIVTIDAV